ncbi:MAG: hypothetical protein L0Z53_17400 [Acidobacteriales bacterium]|nr:hypothetical protein [Terriglobales bacterium]
MKTPNYAQRLAVAQATYWSQRDRKKPRRKLGPFEHKGISHYDRERMRQPLAPIVHPRDFQGWSTPLPSWIAADWNAPDESTVQRVDDLDDPPIAQTADYTLDRCHVETVYERGEWRQGEWVTWCQPVSYRWELTFSDGAVFRFVSREIAEEALSELLKIRKAKHPRPRYGKHSPENELVFLTGRKLRKLPDDIATEVQTTVDTAA